MGVEPTSKAWEAFILPMNYARTGLLCVSDCSTNRTDMQGTFKPFFRFFQKGHLQLSLLEMPFSLSLFFDCHHLLYATLMAAAFKLGTQKHIHNPLGQFKPNKPST